MIWNLSVLHRLSVKFKMPKILIIEARFYEDISDALVAGAEAVLKAKCMNFDRLAVPGALEIAAAISYAHTAQAGYVGYVALGCVIRGQTSHYDYVCAQSMRALMDLTLNKDIAIGNGVLTVENKAQAWARARPEKKDKGGMAAHAVLSMIALKQGFGSKV